MDSAAIWRLLVHELFFFIQVIWQVTSQQWPSWTYYSLCCISQGWHPQPPPFFCFLFFKKKNLKNATVTEIHWDSQRCIPKCSPVLEKLVRNWTNVPVFQVSFMAFCYYRCAPVISENPVLSPFQNVLPLQKGAFPPFFPPGSWMRLGAAVKQSLSQITCT